MDKNIPGPGAYPLTTFFGKEGRKFTFQPRTPYIKGNTSYFLILSRFCYIKCKVSNSRTGIIRSEKWVR
jgi:hypothetical protein